MKQKYLITKDIVKNELIIQELGELLDKDTFILLCEEKYDSEKIESSLKKGKAAIISAFRTKNLYPPFSYAEKVSEGIIELYNSSEKESVEVLFDDKDSLSREYTPYDLDEELLGEESIEVDDLLVDDSDERYDDKVELNNISESGIKLAEDELLDSEEEI